MIVILKGGNLMDNKDISEVVRLLNLSENEFKKYLYKSLTESQKRSIELSLDKTKRSYSRRKQDERLHSLIKISYFKKLKPHMKMIKEQVCHLYCLTSKSTKIMLLYKNERLSAIHL